MLFFFFYKRAPCVARWKSQKQVKFVHLEKGYKIPVRMCLLVLNTNTLMDKDRKNLGRRSCVALSEPAARSPDPLTANHRALKTVHAGIERGCADVVLPVALSPEKSREK